MLRYQSDSLVVKALLITPKEDGKFPVVVFNRGGNRNFAPLTLETMINYTSRLSKEGYVIVGSNYRTNDEFGGAEINDVLALMEGIGAVEKADTSRMGMYGWSRGGMMTYLALKKSNKIKAAVIGNGPSNLFNTIADRPIIETKVLAECVPNYYENKTVELQKRSAIFWAEELNKSSLLLLCGTKDQRVNYQQSVQMGEKLAAIGYDFELQQYDTDHFFTNKKEVLNKAVIDWFNKKLKVQR